MLSFTGIETLKSRIDDWDRPSTQVLKMGSAYALESQNPECKHEFLDRLVAKEAESSHVVSMGITLFKSNYVN